MASLIHQEALSRPTATIRYGASGEVYREAHLEGDWLVIYRVQGHELHLIRTGTHSDLFKE